MNKEHEKIFSGDYSRDMWEAINSAKTKDDLRTALYFVCCRLQELESRLTKRVPDFSKAVAKSQPKRRKSKVVLPAKGG